MNALPTHNRLAFANSPIQCLFCDEMLTSDHFFSFVCCDKIMFKIKAFCINYNLTLRALESQEFFSDSDPSVLDQLKSLHPDKDKVNSKPRFSSSIVVQADIILDTLRSFPKGSAPGLDGLRPEHIIDAVSTVQNICPISVLCDFANLIISGRIFSEAREWLAGGKLCAIKKKDGSARPICIGKVIRRFCSKLVCRTQASKFSSHLAPSQVGVAVSGGAEAVIHEIDLITRQGKKDKNLVILKVDFRNAFNAVNRQVFLDAIYADFPDLYNYISSMYGVPGSLVILICSLMKELSKETL